jgi:hypothetical protein
VSANDPIRAHAPEDCDAAGTGVPNPDSDATRIKPLQMASPAPEPDVPMVPGFEIESTLGRGGMGVVYKAKQLGLNRTVALKMLIAGPFADPSLRARFLLEAESVAALEHPHIIRVYAFGERAGHPYLVMEFLPGGTLADRIKKIGPLPSKEATALLVKLAEAVAHAHSRGVVHRDIKPLNVLLTAEGEPRLTDFGLAKVGRTGQNLSVTGQVLGTPAYMAPEQAAGKVREVGTAADVYALGAVLYDVLTGRPPFEGDSVAVTLQKVLTEEPQRPRRLNAAISPDLETICLKCLEKDPMKRYPTAQALADDLVRYLHNESISVRGASVLDRGYKWLKRNRVVAGAFTGVALALMIGAAVSLGFGLRAEKQANVARKKEQDAEEAAAREQKEKQDALAARNELKQKNDELFRSQERLNRTVAAKLLEPLSTRTPDYSDRWPHRWLPPSEEEYEALWQIVELRRDEVVQLALEEATRTPLMCKRLEVRGEYLLHAVIGLDRKRWDAANRLLLTRMQQEPSSAQTISLAHACCRWEDTSSDLVEESVRCLRARLSEETNHAIRIYLAKSLAVAVARLNPAQAAKECPQTADVLVATLNMEKSSRTCKALAGCLSVVAAQMEPTRAAEVCAGAAETLLAALNQQTDYYSRTELIEGLCRLTGPLEPAKAENVLIIALTKFQGTEACQEIAKALSAVTARMKPTEATKVCAKVADILLAALEKKQAIDDQRRLGQSLITIVSRLEPAPAAAEILISVIVKGLSSDDSPMVSEAMSRIAARLDAMKAARVADRLLTELDRAPPVYVRKRLAEGLATVLVRMEAGPAAKASAQATELLLAALNTETYSSFQEALAEGLAAVLVRMEADPAAKASAQATELLLAARNKKPNGYERDWLTAGLSRVVEHLAPAKAAQVADTFLTELDKETDSSNRVALARGLSRILVRVEPAPSPKVCAKVADILIAAEKWGSDSASRKHFAEGLLGLLERVQEPIKVADFLITAMSRGEDSSTRQFLAEELAKRTTRWEPAKAADLLIVAMSKEGDAQVLRQLARALSNVAGRMEPAQADQVRIRASHVLLSKPAWEWDSEVRQALAEPLLAVAGGILVPEQKQLQPLPPQALVDLLKHPLCVELARRGVLDALEMTYKLKFKDQWEFVEYAQEHQRQLDLLTPPKRRQP